MAIAPKFKVYTAAGEYMASTKYIEDAAVLVSHFGSGATIRYRGHARRDIVWTEGDDGFAADSYDAVVELVATRIQERAREVARKHLERLNRAVQELPDRSEALKD